jgi:hypothetical protein
MIHQSGVQGVFTLVIADLVSHLSTRTFIRHYFQSSTEFLYAFQNKAHVIYMDHGESHDTWVHQLHESDAQIYAQKNMLYEKGMILVDDMFDHAT